ncbi:MAG: hypothetical protein BECKG1743D_GA0114223_101954 [Candidatus Kentron sp. G]|nr:MAG: hypothetical protein BECKG1743E_GA0114224_101824 [Candidatus Kentron sp. G]VFN00281.1 MAG: hypothetical protein BECKG1743F_GA0114225_104712 [Candidatus Kentron sp. G]VFN00439.1 MAG: hypothetical protein BECKG1743D_GA0114223_101954 [Candidatus Kentron sp. G]
MRGQANQRDIPIIHLERATIDKEAHAGQIMAQRGIILLTGYLSCFWKRLESQVVLEITLATYDVIHLDIISACFGTS